MTRWNQNVFANLFLKRRSLSTLGSRLSLQSSWFRLCKRKFKALVSSTQRSLSFFLQAQGGLSGVSFWGKASLWSPLPWSSDWWQSDTDLSVPHYDPVSELWRQICERHALGFTLIYTVSCETLYIQMWLSNSCPATAPSVPLFSISRKSDVFWLEMILLPQFPQISFPYCQTFNY